MPDNNPVAIIGMGCLFPKSAGLKQFWKLLYHGRDAITDVPDSHWSPDEYFDTDPKTPDHVYCKRGGFLDPVAFDPAEFGIPPSSLEATDTSQLLGLMAAKRALEDCGYDFAGGRHFDRDRTSVILGVTGTQELVIPLSSRLGHPRWRKALAESGVPSDKIEEIVQTISSSYVPWQENSFPGLLGNVVAGRISNRLDLRGTNCVVDAACASSLSAVHLGMLELLSGRSDLVITGGVDTLNDIFMHMCFSKTHTLSTTGDVRPFSKNADGTVLGEGVGILVLRRLADAQRDGNRIYAVIKGLGSSSDGKAQSIYSPSVDGQLRALRAAYRNAAIDPATIDLIEAHGTGTRVGDKVEFTALNRFFSESGVNGHKCALGSVKSMIGHTKAAAGAAGLIKTALGLYHKVLPPTLKAETPDPDLEIGNSHFFVNSTTRPWFSEPGRPRRAGVSAFGFGGSNFHIVLEEYDPAKKDVSWDGTVEILAFSAERKQGLVRSLTAFRDRLASGLSVDEFGALAAETRQNFAAGHAHRLLMVHEDDTRCDDLCGQALEALNTGSGTVPSPSENIHIGGPQKPGKLAFVFPGQGSQYLGMGRDIVCLFPQAMHVLEEAARKFKYTTPLTELIFPPPAQTAAERQTQESSLKRTDVAQPAIGAVSLAMLKVLQNFAVSPDAVCGHSFGELTALCAAGWIDEQALLNLAIIRGDLMAAAGENNRAVQGAMLAVQAPLDGLEALVADSSGRLVIANRNSPLQGVLSGPLSAITEIEDICRQRNIPAIRLPVATAFHSELVKDAAQPFLKALQGVPLNPGPVQVYSNTTGRAYPGDPHEARILLGNQLACPVQFIEEIENLFDSGVRTFAEIGPGSVLTGLISTILRDRQFTAVALDASRGKSNGVADLGRMLCRLAALGYPVALTEWETSPATLPKSRMHVLLSGTNYTHRSAAAGNPKTIGKIPPKEKTNPEAETGRTQTADACQTAPLIDARDDSPRFSQPSKPQNKKLPPEAPVHCPSGGSKSSRQTRRPEDTMNNDHDRRSELILDALKVVSQGLQSMQNLQTETARVHQKFLEAQTEANRTLQEMMKNTQRLAESSLGIDTVQIKTVSSPREPVAPHRDSGRRDIAPSSEAASHSAGYAAVPIARDEYDTLGLVAGKVPGGAANGYAQDAADDTRKEEHSVAIQSNRSKIEEIMLEVVGQLTGYPVEMLGLDMDIEAELGIDSIKRVEILSTLEERLPDLPAVSPEIMGTLKTLGQIAEFFDGTAEKPADQAQPTVSGHGPDDDGDTAASGPGVVSPDGITAAILEVVSQLTGYPAEMLGLDMDIEAELGIDSIKRVEILSALEERLPDLPPVSPEIMGTLKTLGQIAGHLSVPVDRVSAPANDDHAANMAAIAADRPDLPERLGSTQAGVQTTAIPRKVVTVVEAPEIADSPISIASNRQIFVTEDNTGLSEHIAAELKKLGLNAVKIPLAARRRQGQFSGTAAGLVIVQDPESCDMEQDLMDAFILVQQLASDLLESADKGGALLATVTRLDGAFGFKRVQLDHPLQGGLAALAKTAAVEWKNVCCHAIDIALDQQDPGETAAAVVREILNPGPIEIGLAAGPRCTLTLKSDSHPAGRLNLNPGDVVVISGGARGITAAAAQKLAAHSRHLRLILLGRSPQPAVEPPWLASLTDEAVIKRALLAHEFRGRIPSPVEIEAAFKARMANREIGRNLVALQATGAEVHYHSVDIRDLAAVRTIIDAVRAQYGEIAAVIHGAGISEDRLIVDKTPEQYRRVFDTKVKGLQNLLLATQTDDLKYLVIFSSVAARFGNQGQVDYAMANEAANKIAQAESYRRTACRVVAVNWGPWESGMVTPGLKREFERRGIRLIPTDQGAECLIHEMATDRNAAVEVVLGAEIAESVGGASQNPKRPTLVKSDASVKKGRFDLCFEQEIDVRQYPILNSHIIDDKPVVPLALIMEWFAHGALHQNPGLILNGLDDIRLLKGIRLERGKHVVRLFAGKLEKRDGFYEVAVELRGRESGSELIHSRATAILSDHGLTPPVHQFADSGANEPYNRKASDIYDDILFHGSQLQGIRKVVSCSPQTMAAHVSTAPGPREWISTPLRERWIADPLVIDCAFQMATLWCFEQKGAVSLPSYAASYRQYRNQYPSDSVKVIMKTGEVAHHKMRGEFTILDSNDMIVATLSGYEAIMDAALIKAFKSRYSAVG